MIILTIGDRSLLLTDGLEDSEMGPLLRVLASAELVHVVADGVDSEFHWQREAGSFRVALEVVDLDRIADPVPHRSLLPSPSTTLPTRTRKAAGH